MHRERGERESPPHLLHLHPELSHACTKHPCALAPLYVGQTAHTPEQRFAQHKAGGRLAAPGVAFALMLADVFIAIIAASVFGLISSLVFSWASNRSAAWNLAFGGALLLCIAAALLLAVIVAMRSFSH